MIKKDIHSQIYFISLLLLAASLPISIFLTSVIQFVLLFNWLIQGEYYDKWQRLRRNKAFWIFSAFYILHLLGMIWSKDIYYGLQDLKIKLPIFIIPFIIVSSDDISSREFRWILVAFISGCVIASLASVMALLNLLPVEIHDFRDASLFMSHIRFSLMVVLAIMFISYLLFNSQAEEPNWLRYFLYIAILWLPVFLILLRALSGIIIILILLLFIAFRFVRTIEDTTIRFMITVIIVTIPLFAVIYVGNSINKFYAFDQVSIEDIDTHTIHGNEYINHIDNKETENGHFVWLHVCPDELETEWAKVSEIAYKGKTKNGDFIRFALIRYMTSKGLRKDSAGFANLTNVDIQAIEDGIANHIYLNRFALYPRIYEAIWEIDRYRLGYSANDKSIIQRYCYLEAGYSIAMDHLLIGVGTGDVKRSFENYYETTDSPLKQKRRKRAHNQYLTLLLTFGIPGFIISLLAFLLPVFINSRWHFLSIIFLLTMALSMLNEDTLENTPGAVMFGLFYALFILKKNST